MKKIIFIFLTLFIFIPSSTALTNFTLGEKSNISSNIEFILREDNKYVYSLNPLINSNLDSYTSYTFNHSNFNLTQTELNRLNLAAYYGYNYTNHEDKKWYAITQLVIYKIIGIKDFFFTDESGNKINDYDKDIEELESLVSSHMTLPSFSYKTFNYTINSENKIKDENSVLNNYDILESNIEASIKDNELIINPNKKGTYKVKLIRKNPVKEKYSLYYKEGNASLLYPGEVSDLIVSVNINVVSGLITIYKKASNNTFTNLEGSIYGIYNDDELITTIKTDEKGVASIEDLPLGKYYIKEITSSRGYKLDPNTYEVNITHENINYFIGIRNEVIKGNVVLNYKLDDEAEFEIYDINDNLVGVYNTSDGKIIEKLEYGEYYIIQTKGTSKIDKFNINIEEEKDYIFNLPNDNKEDILIVEVPNTKKYDYKKIISIIFCLIGILFLFKSIKKTTH